MHPYAVRNGLSRWSVWPRNSKWCSPHDLYMPINNIGIWKISENGIFIFVFADFSNNYLEVWIIFNCARKGGGKSGKRNNSCFLPLKWRNNSRKQPSKQQKKSWKLAMRQHGIWRLPDESKQRLALEWTTGTTSPASVRRCNASRITVDLMSYFPKSAPKIREIYPKSASKKLI